MTDETTEPQARREDAVGELVYLMTKGAFTSPRARADAMLDAIAGGGFVYAYVDTLAAAQRDVRHQLGDGVMCPCCGQRCQAYRRRLNAGMARALILVHREAPAGWVHVPSVAPEVGGDFAKLRHWGLVQEHDGTRQDGGRLGDWRITPLGRSFVRGDVTVLSHVTIYNNALLGSDGDAITIRDALGSRFSYDELMRGV